MLKRIIIIGILIFSLCSCASTPPPHAPAPQSQNPTETIAVDPPFIPPTLLTDADKGLSHTIDDIVNSTWGDIIFGTISGFLGF